MASDWTYLIIVDHARSLEQFSGKAQGGNDKRARCEGEFSGSQSGFRVLGDRPSRRF